jgi:2Fe-2S ferredoxin
LPTVIFIAHDGQRREVTVEPGLSLMRAAVDNGVAGIDGDCGGACACATCHVFVDAGWLGRLDPVGAQEEEMLNFTAERLDNSRLACQIEVTDALDGLTVTLPQGQH